MMSKNISSKILNAIEIAPNGIPNLEFLWHTGQETGVS